MSECSSIDGLVTPYVDGELAGAELEALERHVRACAPCSGRLTAERAVRDLLRDRHPGLRGQCAPASLRANCAALGRLGRALPSAHAGALGMTRPSPWGRRVTSLAVAAALVLLIGGGALYQATKSSSRVMAAELTADHLKCFTMNAVLGTHQSPSVVEASMASHFGWDVRLPAGVQGESLELVGARRCLYFGGTIAHIMYRDRGEPVSLFMLPRTEHAEQLLSVLGHQCAIWSGGDRTFVLVSRDAPADAERLRAFARATFR